MAAVLDIERPRTHEPRTKEWLMANIQGEDHRRLADLVVLLVEKLQERISSLEKQHAAFNATVEALDRRLDEVGEGMKAELSKVSDKLDGGSTWASVVAKNPWLIPVCLILGGVIFGGAEFLGALR